MACPTLHRILSIGKWINRGEDESWKLAEIRPQRRNSHFAGMTEINHIFISITVDNSVVIWIWSNLVTKNHREEKYTFGVSQMYP